MSSKTPSKPPSKGRAFNRKVLRQRPLLTVPQIIVLFVIVAALIIGLDLNRRAEDARRVGLSADAVQGEVDLELTRQVELLATREFVNSQEYVDTYARDEAGQLLPGERRIVPLVGASTPVPTAPPPPTPDPAYAARPWQAWWQLVTDAPLPGR